ncbi:tyramine/octopamine receptor-like [Haliotis rubra]|uniref:tyramine/octopamine receptor-like n=1 Tax=Haliotis rubra TaxID=36100 RepID=UPI001EE605E7|nr:tyramine/octopamine receptor-like [Haliotis rubra]
MLVGFFGNLMACYIYTVRLKAVSSQLFLVALAVLDLIMCSLCIPVEIVSIWYMYLFNHNWLCKCFGTLLLYCSLASGSILVAVAVDRYKLICRPFGKQMTLRETRRAIYLCLFATVIASVPSWITQGTRTVPVPNSNISGYTCATSDDMINTHYPLVYHGFQAILFVTGIVILSSLYSRILMRARKQMQFREKLKRDMFVNNEGLGDKPLADATQHQTHAQEQEESDSGDADFERCQGKEDALTPTYSIRCAVDGLEHCQGKEEVLTQSHSSRCDQSLITNRESRSRPIDVDVMFQIRPSDASHSSVGLESSPGIRNTDKCDFSGGDSHLVSIPTDQWTLPAAEEAVQINVACARRNMSLGKNDGSLSEIDQVPREQEDDAPKGDIVTPRRVNQTGRAMVSRTTTMMIVITLVFVVSFLPHLCAMGVRSILQKTFEDLDGSPLVVYHLCFRSYFINSAVNPLVYSFFNLKFRNEVKGVFRRLCGRNTGT